MNINEIVKIIENLELIYRRAFNSSSRKIFFISIIDYIDLLYQNKNLKILWDVINRLREEDEDLKEFNQVKVKAEKEIKKVFTEVKSFISKNNINGLSLSEQIKKIDSLEKETLSTTMDEVCFKYECVSYALMFLVNKKINITLISAESSVNY
jgi:hypothetical protein